MTSTLTLPFVEEIPLNIITKHMVNSLFCICPTLNLLNVASAAATLPALVQLLQQHLCLTICYTYQHNHQRNKVTIVMVIAAINLL
ncbi:hypothetical protein ACT5AE_000263 [Cronobacter sakazakii]